MTSALSTVLVAELFLFFLVSHGWLKITQKSLQEGCTAERDTKLWGVVDVVASVLGQISIHISMIDTLGKAKDVHDLIVIYLKTYEINDAVLSLLNLTYAINGKENNTSPLN